MGMSELGYKSEDLKEEMRRFEEERLLRKIRKGQREARLKKSSFGKAVISGVFLKSGNPLGLVTYGLVIISLTCLFLIAYTCYQKALGA